MTSEDSALVPARRGALRRWGTFRTGSALLLFASLAQAQEEAPTADDLDLVRLMNVEVSTASKTAESLDDAPAIMTVVTRHEIERWGYQSVAEVLAHVVGFYLTDDHILPDVGVRGMTGGLRAESGMIKVMIDGRSVAYRTTSGNWLGVELIPMGSIKQIEIIRGPASALYGADAFLGVVNVITLDPDQVRPLKLQGSVGSTLQHPLGRIDVVGGGMVGPFDLMLGVAGEKADRSGLSLPLESPAPTLPADIGARRVAENLKRESVVLQGRLGLRDPTTGHVVVSAYGSGIRRGGDFAHWAQLTNTVGPDGQERGTIVSLYQLRLNLDTVFHALPELDLAAQGTYFRGGMLPPDRIEIASDLLYVERDERYSGFDTVVEARWNPHLPISAVAGVETVFDHERLRAPHRVDRATGEEFVVDENAPGADVRLFNVGSFLSLNAKVWDPWLKLTGGARYDHHSQYGDQIAGRLGATSRLSDELVLKLLYGSAFKAPTPYLLYATPLRPGDVVGSPGLLPQLVHTVESQASYDTGRFLKVSSGVSHSWLLDKAEFTAEGINQAARNVARQRSLSWESRVDFTYHRDLALYGSFERVWSRRDLGSEGYVANLIGSENIVYPDWVLRSGAAVRVPSHRDVPLEVGAQGILVGPRRSSDTSIVENAGAFQLDPYLMLDAFVATREVYFVPAQETRFAVRGRNLLDVRGPDPGPAGFEYPLRPLEVFLEVDHVF
jgi:iron complex outermembrane receptor protein